MRAGKQSLEGVGSLEAEVRGGCQPLSIGAGTKPRSAGEHQVFLTTEASVYHIHQCT